MLDFEKNLTASETVLVVNPLNTYWSYQLTTEIALRAKARGASVIWLNAATKPDLNFIMNKQDFYSNKEFRNPLRTIKKVLTKSGIITITANLELKGVPQPHDFSTIEELRSFTFENLPLGAMVFSALASQYQTTSMHIGEVNPQLNHYLRTSFSALKLIRLNFEKFNPTFILTINDRLISSSLAIAVGQEFGTQTRVFYWGSSPDRLSEHTFSLYDSSEWKRNISSFWSKLPRDKSNLHLASNQIVTLKHEPTNDSKEFLTLQVKGKKYPKSRFTCVFYATSEHEHSPNLLGRSASKFGDQYAAFLALQKVVSKFDIQLVFKHHPIRRRIIEEGGPIRSSLDWDKVFFSEGTTVLEPDSDLDTYELIGDADVNVVWVSNVALESIVRGKRTLVLGDAHWLNPDWNIHAWSEEEIVQYFETLPDPLNPQKLLPWYYYRTNYGVPMNYARMGKGGVQIIGRRIFVVRSHIRLIRKVVRTFQKIVSKGT